MAPPTPPSNDEPTRAVPLLPTSGVDSASVFDLPYATDEAALPAPPDPRPNPPDTAPASAPLDGGPPVAAPPAAPTPPPFVQRAPTAVLPPTFSTPQQPATDSFALPPSPASNRRTPPPAMPAPLAAGPLAGPALADGDIGDDDGYGGYDGYGDDGLPLPPMVAKGSWEADHAGGTSPTPPAAAVPAPSSPPTPPSPGVPPTGLNGPAGPAPSGAPAPSYGSAPSYAAAPTYTAPPSFASQPAFGAAVPPPPTPALTFSPDAALSDASGPAAGGSPFASGPSLPPLTPSADPRLGGRAPAPIVSTTRLGDGLLVSAAAAAVAGLIWWGLVVVTQRQFVYVAILLGVMVGQAALIGGRRGSIALGGMAGVFTLLALTFTQYFITRSLAISELGLDLPLWDGTTNAVDVIRATFEEDRLTGLFVVLAAVIAGVQAGTPGKRASGAWGEPRPSRSPAQIL